MEEIEYLEEYEDFILPNEKKRTERISVDRRSIDSLELLYKDLIGDPSCESQEKTNNSQYTEKTNTVIDKISILNTVGDGLLAKPLQTQKCTNSVPVVHQPLYEGQTSNMSFSNRTLNNSLSTYSTLQRPDKLKSVATVKPTLQRVNNSGNKQRIRNNSPPLKNTTIQAFPFKGKNVFGSKVAVVGSKSNLQNKNPIKIINHSQSTGADPLSLEDNDAFLDFDADKNGSVDDLDFGSDLDNSIPVGISDMDSDSVDLSDDYSDGNFDLESDFSSECSETKKGMLSKNKTLQRSNLEENTQTLKNKPGAISAKPENKDQTNLTKRLQLSKVATNEQYIAQKMSDATKGSTQLSFGETKGRKTVKKSQLINKKKTSVRTLTSQTKQSSFNENSTQKLLNNSNGSNVVALNSKKITVVPQGKKLSLVRKEMECLRNSTSTKVKPDKISSEISIDAASNNTIITTESESPFKSSLSQNNTEQFKGKDITDKTVRIKFGPLYLKSIKPPISKDLMLNKISQKSVPSCQQLSEQNKIQVTSLESGNLESGDIKEKNTIPEGSTCKESKTAYNDLKSAHSDILKKYVSRPKSTTYEDEVSYRKSKKIEESDSNVQTRRYTVKSDSLEKQPSTDISKKLIKLNQIDLKENKQIAQPSKCLVEKQQESINEKNSFKKSVAKMKPNENTTDKDKVSGVQYNFKVRSFDIRLNKNSVAQFIRSSAVYINSKVPTTLKIQEENVSLKRKMFASPNASDSISTVNVSSESGKIGKHKFQKDQNSETSEICKKSRMTSDISPMIFEIQTQINEKKESTKSKACPTLKNRKRKKLRMNATPKTQRSNIRSSSQTSDTTTNHPTIAAESSKETSLQNPTSRSSMSSNSKSTETEKVRKRIGRPISKKNLRKAALSSKSKKMSQPNITAKDINVDAQKDRTPIETSAPLTESCMRDENIEQSTTQCTDSTNSEVQIIEPKKEYYGDTIIVEYEPEPAISNRDNLAEPNQAKFNGCHEKHSNLKTYEAIRRNNQLLLNTCTNVIKSLSATNTSDCRNRTEFSVFELPSYIVMKTKIITRQDLNSGNAIIPPIVKKTIDSLTDESPVRPIFKKERTDLKDVCSEINALLVENGNYLKFATGTERQSRMNQVLADSSLSVEEAQCALKFLQSYLSIRSKEISVRSKSQQFIPIYDSQKNIIGYRKRTIRSKKFNNSNKTSVANRRMSNLNTYSSLVERIPKSDTTSTHPISATLLSDTAVDFMTKEEPQLIDTGNEEIIVPDAPPNSEIRIKNEVDTANEVAIGI